MEVAGIFVFPFRLNVIIRLDISCCVSGSEVSDLPQRFSWPDLRLAENDEFSAPLADAGVSFLQFTGCCNLGLFRRQGLRRPLANPLADSMGSGHAWFSSLFTTIFGARSGAPISFAECWRSTVIGDARCALKEPLHQ